ncbi:hypothetical protein BU26DRAFT_582928 [Trematosphaeria pertusa]|uniref:BZIP domain-containing protein n=1 Tax=Trematosphaeria pertusa TaxID=390896 RepID=A0A6A6IVT7_9PLEO|nr:uncharacterized protein BU26DRAFT_582928 [Trematosphaeria pertusa]KAF2254378.1 hypothetical protein BU26DRAFT_582928 [Trematosphaeria pertusa]
MVNRRASDAAPQPSAPIAPVVKRKRRASCLGEAERRERKRAIDREAQRSLREKTKTHIAELERTIEILRNQDRNGATAGLLSEIEGLRAENERLRDVIDCVKSVVGGEVLPRTASVSNQNGVGTAGAGAGGANSPTASVGQHSPTQSDAKPPPPLPSPPLQSETPNNQFHFSCAPISASRPVDLDGMTVLPDFAPLTTTTNRSLSLDLDLHPLHEASEDSSMLDVPDSPTTAAFAPFMSEIFGPSWRCPSPVILHIGNPPSSPSTTSSSTTSSIPGSLCPIWKKSNELFGKVFSYRPGTAALNVDSVEAGLLYLGIKDGWSSFDQWMGSPALRILKQVDEFLFRHLEKMERLAVAYKSFKLLKYYLNATKEELEKVPEWLRPSPSQARTKHPIALDFFAWPTLRDRLVQHHTEIFKASDLSHSYSHYLKFDWPFSFEDAFFYDEMLQGYYPSPLFERYHRDLRYWTVTERFYEKFPEMRGDIEGDRGRFAEGEVC